MFRIALLLGALASLAHGQTRFSVRFEGGGTFDGRLLLMLAPNNKAEPRMQVGADRPDTAIIYGMDVEGWKPGAPATFDSSTFGFPIRSLAQVPKGRYWAQALLHEYETFRRSDGHTVKLPMDRGEGQHWNLAPGNLYSTPVEIAFDAAKTDTVELKLTNTIAPIVAPKDTKYIKHVRIQSERLTKFWGRPMHLGASVLLPEGWESHTSSRYPLVVYHGHFSPTISGFRETPPDPNLKPDYSERFRVAGYNRIQQELAHEFYKDWTGRGFPRVLLVEIQHANPYYDDSYAVNSANLGPYGDAIMYELIPYIEKQFRGLGTGWSRATYGGSTGGWEALAVQVFYPDAFNGSYAACPDPIDFRAYTTVNLYEHQNAYYVDSAVKRTPRPGKRNWLGEVSATVEEMNHLELVLGTNSRSGDQFDIWEAVYSPVGTDGYPKRIFDKMTGKIDRTVAEYWRENYDLRHILQRDWAKLGTRLEGKINIYCGDMDNYYLNNAVYLMEAFLKGTRSPYYGGEVEYGDRAEHCWNGDHTRPNHISRLRYHQMYIPRIAERILKTAPTGADLSSWRY